MKGSKISIALAATALAVALFAATPFSQAATRLVLGNNSVGPRQLKKNAVTTAKVKNGSLLAADFKTGQLPAGRQGPKGDPGAAGPTGPSDAFVSSTAGPIAINTFATLRSLTLPPGRYVLTGRALLQAGVLEYIRCRFTPSGTGQDALAKVAPPDYVGINLTDTESLSATTTIDFVCLDVYNATATAVVVTATRVGTLTTQ